MIGRFLVLYLILPLGGACVAVKGPQLAEEEVEHLSNRIARLVKSDLASEVRKMKNASGDGMAILGSGTIVAQLAQEGLIDEYQIAVIPVVLGAGRTMFEGIKRRLNLTLKKTRVFGNGNVVLWYEPVL